MGTVDVWSGNIQLPDGGLISDVFLSFCGMASPVAIPSGNLRFLTLIEIGRIPLYVTAGPSLDVWTTSQETENWFSELLHHSKAVEHEDPSSLLKWRTFGISQSPVGILAEVEIAVEETKSPHVTEVLFYSTNSTSTHGGRFPTPPQSSSGGSGTITLGGALVLRVHAIPLSSDLLCIINNSTINERHGDLPEPISGSLPDATEARFLSNSIQSPMILGSSKGKRREINEMFQNATERRKKVRKSGGEGVAAAAARFSTSHSRAQHNRILSHDITARKYPFNSGGISTEALTPQELGISRRSSSVISEPRPASQSGLMEPQAARNSSLKTVTLSNESQNLIENQNRDVISRIVMASMRMYGLQQHKKTKKSRRPSTSTTSSMVADGGVDTVPDSSNDEEYKLVYHNTFKSAVFAFRNHIATEPLYIQPSRLRDTIDKLLAIFCSDSTMTSFPLSNTPNKANPDLSVSSDVYIHTPSKDVKRTSQSGGGGSDPSVDRIEESNTHTVRQ